MTRLAGLFVAAALVLGPLVDSGPAGPRTFPGRNGLISYTLPSGLYVVNADGTVPRNATVGLAIRAVDPAFAADGNRIAFSNTAPTNSGIWFVRADGTLAARVTTEANDREPTWSPDGRRIAFVRNEGGVDRLFAVGEDGGGLGVLTPFVNVNVRDPEWSPDGTRFAFSDGTDVYVVNADGSVLRKLTGSGTPGNLRGGRSPTWKPDGSTIAFGAGDSIRTIRPDGTGNRQLVGGLRGVAELAWAPDGTKIAFVADGGGAFQDELFSVNADGSGLTRLNVDTEAGLDWGPALVLPPPVAGSTVNAGIVSGVVRVRVVGTKQFVNMAASRQIPLGSELDVTRGSVRVTSDAGGGQTQIGIFSEGRGIVRQPATGPPVTTLALSGPLPCPRKTSPAKRRLFGDATGRFRTTARYAAATVRGTMWLTEDRCNGTFVRVQAGQVEVFDNVRRRRVVVNAGQSYFARAPTR